MLPGDLRSRLIEGQVDRQQDADAMKGYEEIALRNGLTGEAFYKFPHTGIREYNVGRLKALLSEGLNIQYGRSFSHANFEGDTVTAVFEDGSSILGSVLIGTDGGSSMVRRFAVKSPKLAEAEVLPFNMVNLTTTFPAEQAILIRSKIHPVADIGMHPKGMYFRLNILDIVDPEKPETWEFQLLSTWPYSQGGRLDSPEKRFEMFKSLAKDWCDPHRSAVEWLPCSVKLHDDHLRDWITTSWYDHDGRLTMGGDALHAMTFREFPSPIWPLAKCTLTDNYHIQRPWPRGEQRSSRCSDVRRCHEASARNLPVKKGGSSQI